MVCLCKAHPIVAESETCDWIAIQTFPSAQDAQRNQQWCNMHSECKGQGEPALGEDKAVVILCGGVNS